MTRLTTLQHWFSTPLRRELPWLGLETSAAALVGRPALPP